MPPATATGATGGSQAATELTGCGAGTHRRGREAAVSLRIASAAMRCHSLQTTLHLRTCIATDSQIALQSICDLYSEQKALKAALMALQASRLVI